MTQLSDTLQLVYPCLVRSYDNFDPGRIKHLELIQAVISRLGSDGFLMKGWALTISGAFLGFAVNTHDAWLALAGVFPAFVFWGLDTYFLRAERLFRKLYDRARQGNDVEPFFMSGTSPDFRKLLSQEELDQVSWWKTLRRPSLSWFYAAILVATVFVAIVLAASSDPHVFPQPSQSTGP